MSAPTKPQAESPVSGKFRIKVLAIADRMVQARAAAGLYGELTIKFSSQNGELTGAKIVEEIILKPGD